MTAQVEHANPEIKSQIADLNKLFEEAKSANAERVEEVKKYGEELGQTKEKVDKIAKGFEEKFSQIEAVITRQGSQAPAVKDSDFDKEFKSYNKMLAAYNKPALAEDQAEELKSAFDQFVRKGERSLSPEQYKTINASVDPQGGYFVVPQYNPTVLSKKFDGNGLMEVISTQTIGSGDYKEIIDWADYEDSYYSQELAAASSPSDNEDFKEVTWTPHEQIYSKKFSRTALEDAFINIESHVLGKMREGAMRQTAEYVTSGNGVNKPKGILSYADGTTYGTVERKTSNVTGALVWDDVLNTLPASLKDKYHENASFVMRRTAFFKLLTDKDGMGSYQIGNQINFFDKTGVSLSILGYPVKWEANMPAVGAGNLAVAFGDFREAYKLVDRVGFSILRDDQTNPKTITVHLRRRNDGKVRNFEAYKLLTIKS